jgi:hypothetical protein
MGRGELFGSAGHCQKRDIAAYCAIFAPNWLPGASMLFPNSRMRAFRGTEFFAEILRVLRFAAFAFVKRSLEICR